MPPSLSLPTTIVCNREATPFFEAAGMSSTAAFACGPHYEFVDAPRFLCFVPLLSSYALLPAARIIDARFHVLELIPEHIIAAASEGRCHLVFDAGTEGDPLIIEGFDYLHLWLDGKGISRHDITYINQNRRLGELYFAQFGAGPKFVCFDYYVKRLLSAMQLDDHAFEASTGSSRAALPSPGLRDSRYSFLCMNGAPRANRILLVAGLLSKGLLDDCYWSMLGAAANKIDTVAADAMGYRDAIGASWISDNAIEAVLGLMPRIFSDEAVRVGEMRDSNELANSINANSFCQGAISIVTETEFSGGDVLRLTEKTLKPFSLGHPAIVAGNPMTLSLVKELGFQTFSGLIDENYDETFDPGARLLRLIEAAVSMRDSKDTKARGAIEEVCSFNANFARERAAREYESSVEMAVVASLRSAIN